MEFHSEYLPQEPSQALVAWAKKRLLKHTHALVYRRAWRPDPATGQEEECVEAKCSICGSVSELQMVRTAACSRGYGSSPPFGFYDHTGHEVIAGQSALCPVCKQPVKVVYNSSVRDMYTMGSCLVLDVQNIMGYLVLIYWRVERQVDDNAIESMRTAPKVAYVVGTRRIDAYEMSSRKWHKRHQYKDIVGKEGDVYPWKKSILEYTTAKNSKLDLYMKCKGEVFPVSYLRLWCQRPSVENLLVQGVGTILAEMIRRDCKSSYWGSEVNIPKLADVNWKDKRPAQMLGICKEDLRWAASQQWHLDELELFRKLASRENVKPEIDIPLIRQCGINNLTYLVANQANGSVMRSVRYLVKQRKCDAITLLDYWRLVTLNGGDVDQPRVRFPQDLHRAHDTEAARQRFEKQKGYTRLFESRTQALGVLSFAEDDLMIRPVSSAEELYQEGKLLHHCVYSYLENHVLGKTAIFLIRKASEPDKPYFTLELDENALFVKQNRGLRNCARTDEVRKFEEKWLSWVKAQQKERSKTA